MAVDFKGPEFCEDEHKAAFAQLAGKSKGRLIDEADCPMRSAFQRDRDRLVHSNAFRRLTHKTQVFVCHEGDHFRSRLTHSLEVSQIARSIARTLQLDEDLAECVALAHDFGHTPFGHAGERALQRALKGKGGFDHNIQSLKILVRLEKRYPAFDGLNLSWESLEGVLKHNGPVVRSANEPLDDLLTDVIGEFLGELDLKPHEYASAEAQVAALADDIAYNNHDLDDGLRGGLYQLEDLKDVPLVYHLLSEIREEYPGLEEKRQIYELNRRLITVMVKDVVGQTRKNVETLKIDTAEKVRKAGCVTVSFSDSFKTELNILRKFLLERVYKHEKILAIMQGAEQVVEDLALKYLEQPETLPERYQRSNWSDGDLFETVRNYVAGMTDRYALEQHRQLFDRTPELR